MSILVTGGTGYIGSHTCVSLINNGFEVIVVDNLSGSDSSILAKIQNITGVQPKFYPFNLCDKSLVKELFEKEEIHSVIHFAAKKAVGESVEQPLTYYQNNLISTLNLLEIMEQNQVFNLIYSSSATVYGEPRVVPIIEDAPLSANSPYGSTKIMQEQILKDIYNSNQKWSFSILRYFNPIGAHESGLLPESPKGIPLNLMPYLLQVATGRFEKLKIYGSDYPTKDGTGVRDYIHVMDLAEGHLATLKQMQNNSGFHVYNLGTGIGYSVLDIINTFEKVNGISIPYEIADRRLGDVAICYANPRKAEKELSWRAEMSLEDMCRDSWRTQQTYEKKI